MGRSVSRRKRVKKGGFTLPKEVTIIREVIYASHGPTRAQPVQTGYMSWQCSQCGTSCYYDGRCGDGPILVCKCNEAEDNFYAFYGNR